jgi:hypothetical protein
LPVNLDSTAIFEARMENEAECSPPRQFLLELLLVHPKDGPPHSGSLLSDLHRT